MLDDLVIHGEGLFEFVFVRRFAREVDVFIGVILFGNFENFVGEGVGLVVAFGQREVDEHAVIVRAFELRLGAVHLDLGILEHLCLVVAERDDAGVHLIADKEEHVDERDFVGGKVARKLAIF